MLPMFPVCSVTYVSGHTRRRPGKERRVTEFPGGDAAHLSGLRVLSSLRPCSPGRRFAPPPGKERRVTDFPGGDAAHLSGLSILSSLRACSPGRRFAPPPGKERRVTDFPGGDAAHLSGLRILSSLRPGRPAPPPGKARRVAEFPGGDAAHLSGLRVLSSLRACSPAKRSASRGIIGYSAEARAPAPRSAAGCVSAQSEYVDTADPAYPPDSGGDYCARFLASRE